MSTPPQTLAGFLDRVRPFQDLWPSIEIRYSIVLQGDRWCNLWSRVRFLWEDVRAQFHEPEIETPIFRAGRLFLPMEDGLEWLREAESGAVSVAGRTVHLGHEVRRPGSDVPLRTQYGWNVWKLDRNGGLQSLLSPRPESEQGYRYAGFGEWANSLLDPIGWSATHDNLLSAAHPYAGLGEFSVGFLGYTEALGPTHSVGIEVDAVYGTLFHEWVINDDTDFVASVQHPNTVPPGDLSITAILSLENRSLRLHIPVNEGRPVPDTPVQLSDFKFPFTGFHQVELHLLLRGHDVDVLDLPFPSSDTPNVRLRAIEGLDLVWANLTTTLEEARAIKTPAALEMLVSWVLHLCGFQTMLVGHPPLQGGDVPDMVAYDPYSNNGLVVEVTRDLALSQDKLARLARRTSAIQASSSSVRFYAVAAAPAIETFGDQETSAASDLGVALLSHRDLTQLLNVAQSNPLPAEVLRKVILAPTTERWWNKDSV